MEPTDIDKTKDHVINPYYAVSFQDYLFEDHKIRESKEDWVARNSELIDENGAKAWLEQLLQVLTNDGKPLMQELVNPYKTITFSTRLHGKHKPTVTSKQWTLANAQLIGEIGPGDWLWRLIGVLEMGGPEVSE